MSTLIVPTVNSIPMEDNRRPLQSIAAILLGFGYEVRAVIRAMSDVVERRFADFAAVPYQDSLSRQQWEELWEAEASCFPPHSCFRYATRPRCLPDRAKSTAAGDRCRI